MEIKFNTAKIIQDGGNWLCLKVDEVFQARQFIDSLQSKQYIAELKEFRKKRSLNANSYAWALIGKLSEVLEIPSVEIYKSYIKLIGMYRDVEIAEDAQNTFIKIWSEHGTGWLCEKVDYSNKEGFVQLRCWYGSSSYNTKQMSTFIKIIVDDCNEQGIQTKTIEEQNRLTSLWEAVV